LHTSSPVGNDAMDAGYCAGYIAAAMDFGMGFDKYCPDEGVTFEQGIRIFLHYIAEHPEKLNHSPGPIVLASLAEAFPCQRH
jgi:hypothetical protein